MQMAEKLISFQFIFRIPNVAFGLIELVRCCDFFFSALFHSVRNLLVHTYSFSIILSYAFIYFYLFVLNGICGMYQIVGVEAFNMYYIFLFTIHQYMNYIAVMYKLRKYSLLRSSISM